jgi:hypothetical protein
MNASPFARTLNVAAAPRRTVRIGGAAFAFQLHVILGTSRCKIKRMGLKSVGGGWVVDRTS